MNATVNQPIRQPGDVNLLSLLGTTALTLIGLAYLVIAMSSGNPFWMLPNRVAIEPATIEIFQEGERQVIRPGDPHYAALTSTLNEALNRPQGYQEVGMNERTATVAREQYTTVVMHYAEPFRLNTRWNLGSPNEILIPISGSYSNKDTIFTGTNGRYGHGGLILEDLSPFLAAVERAMAD